MVFLVRICQTSASTLLSAIRMTKFGSEEKLSVWFHTFSKIYKFSSTKYGQVQSAGIWVEYCTKLRAAQQTAENQSRILKQLSHLMLH